MPRNFATRFNRLMSAGFLADGAPVGAQVVNNPATGAGPMFRMPPSRQDDQKRTTNRWQAYFTSNVVGLTMTVTLWIAQGLGTAVGATWVQVGPALAAIPQNRMVFLGGTIQDADVFVEVTLSALLGVGETANLLMEETEL